MFPEFQPSEFQPPMAMVQNLPNIPALGLDRRSSDLASIVGQRHSNPKTDVYAGSIDKHRIY